MNEKILRIMELALLINPTATVRSETGDKPTVFIRFFGHVSLLEVSIHEKGWWGGSVPQHSYACRIDESTNIFNPEELDKCLQHLESIYKELKQKEPDSTAMPTDSNEN